MLPAYSLTISAGLCCPACNRRDRGGLRSPSGSDPASWEQRPFRTWRASRQGGGEPCVHLLARSPLPSAFIKCVARTGHTGPTAGTAKTRRRTEPSERVDRFNTANGAAGKGVRWSRAAAGKDALDPGCRERSRSSSAGPRKNRDSSREATRGRLMSSVSCPRSEMSVSLKPTCVGSGGQGE